MTGLTETRPRFDGDALRQAFGAFPSGVVAVAGLTNGGPAGMAASSFTSVSLEPALVSLSMASSSSTWAQLRCLRRIGLSVLNADQGGLCRALASGPVHERFDGVDHETTADGAILVRGAALWMECSVAVEHEAGDHLVVLLELHAAERFDSVEPLVFHGSQFRRLGAA